VLFKLGSDGAGDYIELKDVLVMLLLAHFTAATHIIIISRTRLHHRFAVSRGISSDSVVCWRGMISTS
jgi:hypothetical protein